MTPWCRRGHYTFPWIAPLYPWFIHYKAECEARRHQVRSISWLLTYKIQNDHIYIYIYMCVCVCVYTVLVIDKSSSSSSSRTDIIKFLDSFLPSIQVIYCSWLVFSMHLMSIQSWCKFFLVGQHWPIYEQESIKKHCLCIHPAVPCMSHSSHLFCGHLTAILFDVAPRIFSRQHVAFLCIFHLVFFFICFVSIHMVHPCSSMETATAGKKFCFILLEKSDFQMIHVFSRHMLTSLSVDEILLLRYVNRSTNFKGLPLKVKMARVHSQQIFIRSQFSS